ncbi:J domain-containing protein [Paenibacillus paeoniae]|uniref:J domain-containing protein n=1 Tax=Paenibacillus paeoniae TaxID=2292705 RepID=A0A371PE59_9BACL|nr:J domain-containing protein [Paenibacillus paeoniae]REK74197.1 J domain-containing protein [Paenibacillus paeoniae]
MDCWAVLGINQTADTAVIRKAYKQQLLVYHPEDDPAGYQKVRAAYSAAMNEAKFLTKVDIERTEVEAKIQADEDTQAGVYIQTEANTQTETYTRVTMYTQAEANTTEAPSDADNRSYRRLFVTESVGFQEDDSSQDGGHENEEHQTVTRHFFTQQEQVQDKTKAENDFMVRLENLLNDHGRRNDPETWKALLSDDVLWDIQSKSRIDDYMLRVFSQHYSGLNNHIWVIIESHIGLFDKINRKIDEYPASFVDTYALATQNIAPPQRLKHIKISEEQIIKKPDVNGWRYCFGIPIFVIILIFIGNVLLLPLYLLSVLVRGLLLIFRRNWKIIMWEYTFTHINRWGKRYDYKYIDIIKIEPYSDEVVIYLKGKRIIIKTESHVNVPYLLAKLSRY